MISLQPPNKPLRQYLNEWNTKYPVDLIWRAKNNVQFGSIEHKSMDFLSMLFNLMQEHDIAEYKKEQEIQNDEFGEYSQVYKDQNKVVKMSKQEIDDVWDELDLDKLNEGILNGDTKGNNIQS